MVAEAICAAYEDAMDRIGLGSYSAPFSASIAAGVVAGALIGGAPLAGVAAGTGVGAILAVRLGERAFHALVDAFSPQPRGERMLESLSDALPRDSADLLRGFLASCPKDVAACVSAGTGAWLVRRPGSEDVKLMTQRQFEAYAAGMARRGCPLHHGGRVQDRGDAGRRR